MDLTEAEKKKQEILNKLYTELDSPAAYSGLQRLYDEARKIDPSITKGDVQYYLEGDRIYTMHRPRRLKFKKAKFIPAGFMTDLQIDLGDFQKISNENKGHKYILLGVDVLSKRFFASPVKTKRTDDMIKAFDHLLEQMPQTPHRIFSDRGK
jgi:hypothetical protein